MESGTLDREILCETSRANWYRSYPAVESHSPIDTWPPSPIVMLLDAAASIAISSEMKANEPSALIDANVESRGGIAPPRAPRTVREPLDSYGSRCSAVAMT